MGGKIKHRQVDCIIVILIGMYAGNNFFKDIIDYAKKNYNGLNKLLSFLNGLPSHDTLERAMHRISSQEFNESLGILSLSLLKSRDTLHIALDGKFVRATRDHRSNSALNIMSAYECKQKLSIFSVLESGSNSKLNSEHVMIPKLLKILKNYINPDKTIISIDAIGAVRPVLKELSSSGYGFVICVKKEEMQGLGGSIRYDFAYSDIPLVKKLITSNGGRVNHKTYKMIVDLSYLKGIYPSLPSAVKRIGMVITETMNKKTGSASSESRYFLLSDITLTEFIETNQKHWNIEASHYVLDNSFQEDRQRIKKGSSCLNMNLLRKFVMNVIGLNTQNVSITTTRRENKYLYPSQIIYQILYNNGKESVQNI